MYLTLLFYPEVVNQVLKSIQVCHRKEYLYKYLHTSIYFSQLKNLHYSLNTKWCVQKCMLVDTLVFSTFCVINYGFTSRSLMSGSTLTDCKYNGFYQIAGQWVIFPCIACFLNRQTVVSHLSAAQLTHTHTRKKKHTHTVFLSWAVTDIPYLHDMGRMKSVIFKYSGL